MPSHLLSTSRIHASFGNLWLKWLLGLLHQCILLSH